MDVAKKSISNPTIIFNVNSHIQYVNNTLKFRCKWSILQNLENRLTIKWIHDTSVPPNIVERIVLNCTCKIRDWGQNQYYGKRKLR